MINQPRLIIGEQDLTRYLGPEPRKDQARMEEMYSELRRNRLNTLSIEKNYFEDLARKLMQESYPELDTSFFQESEDTIVRDFRLKVPRFCIYPVEGKNKFDYNIEFRTAGAFLTNWRLFLTFRTEPDLVHHIQQHLFKSTGLVDNPKSQAYITISSDKSQSEIKRMITELKRVKITVPGGIYCNTFLNARVPDSTREEINLAKRVFSGAIGFVAERKPSDWVGNPEIITTTPLAVVGFSPESKCYLISNFNLPKTQLNQEPKAE